LYSLHKMATTHQYDNMRGLLQKLDPRYFFWEGGVVKYTSPVLISALEDILQLRTKDTFPEHLAFFKKNMLPGDPIRGNMVQWGFQYDLEDFFLNKNPITIPIDIQNVGTQEIESVELAFNNTMEVESFEEISNYQEGTLYFTKNAREKSYDFFGYSTREMLIFMDVSIVQEPFASKLSIQVIEKKLSRLEDISLQFPSQTKKYSILVLPLSLSKIVQRDNETSKANDKKMWVFNVGDNDRFSFTNKALQELSTIDYPLTEADVKKKQESGVRKKGSKRQQKKTN